MSGGLLVAALIAMDPMSIRIPDSPTDLERLQWERAAEAGDNLAMCSLGYLHAEQMKQPDLRAAPPLVRAGRRGRVRHQPTDRPVVSFARISIWS